MCNSDDHYGSRPGEYTRRLSIKEIADRLVKEARQYSLEYDCPLFEALNDVADEWEDLNPESRELAELNILKD